MTGNQEEKDNKKSQGTATTLLERIETPADLRRLDVGQLPQVCSEIRDFLIHALAENPGHFASSMGAVELTVALHYVYDTPYDRIVWDVGHQAYGHKLLTGRRERFHTNRKLNGLSGFPNPDESEYDTFSAGHASNSISAALGMAVATRLSGETPRRHVVAVIGDASISGGLAFEGLNNAANTPNDLLIILNDNNMSIDPNVGSFHSYLAKITTSRGYNDFRYSVYHVLKKMRVLNDSSKGAILRLNNSIKSFLTREQNIFEGLDIRYFGPVDGHDVEGIVRVLRDIKGMSGPKLLHIKTVKGKGYGPAERDPSRWHAPGRFNPETGELKGGSCDGLPKFQDIFGDTVTELAERNRRIVGITAAMLSGTSLGTMLKALPDRVFDVGISEEHAVTFAGGLAKEGLLPFVAIYSSFLQRAYDQIVNDVAIQHLPVTFCIDRAGLVGEDGVTHHGVFDIAWLTSVPGMTVASARDGNMLRNLLYTAQADPQGPMAIRYPRGKVPAYRPEEPIKVAPRGKGELLSDGTDIVFLSEGTMAAEVQGAISILDGAGISACHYDMIYLKPLDADILNDIVRRGKPVVTVENGIVNGGLGSAVASWLTDRGVCLPLATVGIPDRFVAQGTVAELRQLCGMDAQSIAATAIRLLRQRETDKNGIGS